MRNRIFAYINIILLSERKVKTFFAILYEKSIEISIKILYTLH